MYENYFRGLGVVPVLAGDREQPSGVLVTIVDPDGERSFLTDRGANLTCRHSDLPVRLLDETRLGRGLGLFAVRRKAATCGALDGRARRKRAASRWPSIRPRWGSWRRSGPDNFLDWTRRVLDALRQ